MLVVGFFSGSLVDRFGCRAVLIAAQSAHLVLMGVIAVLLWSGHLVFWHLCVTAVGLGVCWSLDWPTRKSYLLEVVGRARTVDAVLLDGFGQNIALIAGPFAGGALIEGVGVEGCYTGLAVLSALALWPLLGLTPRPSARRVDSVQPSQWKLLGEGLRYVRRNQPIFGVLLVTVVINFFSFSYLTLLPVFARDILNQGPMGLGLLGAANGVGRILGLFAINRIRDTVSSGWIFAGGAILQASTVAAFAASTSFPLSAALLVFSGVGQVCFGVMQTAIVLLSSSDEMRSRAMGTLVLAIGGGPPGKLYIGALGEGFGAPFAVGCSAAVAALFAFGVAMAMPKFRRVTKGEDEDSETDTAG
jgi:MFS family permease